MARSAKHRSPRLSGSRCCAPPRRCTTSSAR